MKRKRKLIMKILRTRERRRKKRKRIPHKKEVKLEE